MPDDIGIYYLLGPTSANNTATVLYVGKAGYRTNMYGRRFGGLRTRVLEHIQLNEWSDVVQIAYQICNSEQEMDNLEASEIATRKPRHNTIGK